MAGELEENHDISAEIVTLMVRHEYALVTKTTKEHLAVCPSRETNTSCSSYRNIDVCGWELNSRSLCYSTFQKTC